MARQCEVKVHGIRAGVLTEDDRGGYQFKYDQSYMSDSQNEPVSLTMPFREEPYQSEYLFPCFFNMLSEGANRQIQSQLLHIDASDDFGILLATAQSDTIGSVTVKPIES